MYSEIFDRTERIMGADALQDVFSKRVIIFGIGGVGSWCAEALVRTGIHHLTIVDSDCVSITNINRQLMATSATVGMSKVEALKNRLLDINPDAEIVAIQKIYNEESANSFNLNDYDYVVDAIDSINNKALLIINACASNAKLFSSMGAALKMDSTKIRVGDFWSVEGCPLGKVLRKKFKREKTIPQHGFLCVYSPEVMENKLTNSPVLPKNHTLPSAPSAPHNWDLEKKKINGSMVHITGIFGFTLSGLILQDIVSANQ
ncbi:MAG: tRNA threonylcarbamoyladenosine dehydratase [Marinilabiliaceae bacterium]|nr:tRNA threonylcarbamoyladenosine dehydratase [Marinilabiliaceae bacterium]